MNSDFVIYVLAFMAILFNIEIFLFESNGEYMSWEEFIDAKSILTENNF